MNEAQRTRALIGGGIVVALLIALLSWFVAIRPQLSSASSLRSQTTDSQLTNDVLRAKLRTLEKADQQRSSLAAELSAARDALPTTNGLPDLTRQIAAQTAATQVALTGIRASAPVLTSSSATGAATATGNPAGKLFAIPVTLTTVGALTNQRNFLEAVQQDGPRAALVSSVSFLPSSNATTGSLSSITTMTVQLQVFVAPQTEAEEQQLRKLTETSS